MVFNDVRWSVILIALLENMLCIPVVDGLWGFYSKKLTFSPYLGIDHRI